MDLEANYEQYLDHLVANPHDLQTLRRMEQNVGADWGGFINALIDRAEETDREEVSARFLLEAARVAFVRAEEPEMGRTLLERAVDAAEGTQLTEEVRLFELAFEGKQEELSEYFARALQDAENNEHRARLYLRMGVVLERVFDDLAEAENAYSYALEVQPDNLPALWARERIARDTEKWGELSQLLYQELELLDEVGRQVEVALELGDLYDNRLGDEDAAAECYEFARGLAPENEEVRQRLVDLGRLEDAGDADADEAEELETAGESDVETAEELEAEVESEADVEALEDEQSQAEPPESADEVESEEDAEFDQEVEAAPVSGEPVEENEHEDVVELEDAEEATDGGPPSEVPTDEDLEDDQEEQQVEAESADDSPVEGEADHEDREDEDIEELEVISDEDEATGEAVDAAEEDDAVEDVEVAEEPEPPEEPEPVEDDVTEAEDEPGESVEAGAETDVSESASEAGDWTTRFDGWLDEAADAADETAAIDALMEAARLAWLHGASAERAADLWSVAGEQRVADALFGEVHYLFDGATTWGVIADRLEESGVDDAVLARVALFGERDREKSETLAEAAGAQDVIDALDDLEEAEDNWRRFQRSLEKEHRDLPDAEQATTVYEYLADLARAADLPDKEVDALRRLDRQVDSDAYADRMMASYRRAEQWPKYVDMVKEQAKALPESRTEDKIDLLLEAVRVYRDEMEHDMMVVNTYRDILELEPDNVAAVDRLIDKYEEMGRSSELINMLEKKAEIVDEEAERIELLTEIADLYLDKFRNKGEAIEAYEQVLDIDPYHEQALEFLTEMYENRRDWENLVDVRRRKVELLEEPERTEDLKEVAELATERLRDPELATDLWLEVRESQPDDRDALDALEQLYEKSRDYESLTDVLETKVELVDESEAMELYQKLGMMYSDRLEDPERAIEAWRAALELDPDNRKANKSLERLYIDNRRWDDLEAFYADQDAHKDLTRTLETLAGTVEEDEVKIEVLLRAARIWRETLEDAGRAKRNLERALELDPNHEGVARQLEPIYRDEGNDEGLRQVLEIILSHQDAALDRQEYLLRLGDLEADAFEQPGEAFDRFAAAFAEAPREDELVDKLEDVADRAGRYEQVAELYRDTIQALDAGETPAAVALLDEQAEELEGREALARNAAELVRSLRLRLGRVLFEELGRGDEALDQYDIVLDEEPDNTRALAAMEAIYSEAERWDDLMEVYRRRLELTDEDDIANRVEILHGMATIAEEQAGDLPTAVDRLQEALELDPASGETLRELHRLYREQEAWADLADVIDREIELVEERASERADDAGDRPIVDPDDILMEEPEALADEVSQGGDDVSEETIEPDEESPAAEAETEVADEAAVEAEESDPSDETESEESSVVVRDRLYTEQEVERLVELRHELGAVCHNHLQRDERAVEVLSTVVRWRPDYRDAIGMLETYLEGSPLERDVASVLKPVYEIQGAWSRLVDALEVELDGADEEQSVSLLEQIAEIELEEIGDPEASFSAWSRLLRRAPSHDRARNEAHRIAGNVDLWAEYADLLEELAYDLPEERENLRTWYLYNLGEVYAERLDEPERAEQYFRDLLDIEPDSLEALEALETVYTRTEQWRQLQEVFERQVEEVDDAERAIAIRFREAAMLEELLEVPNEAIDVLREVLEDDPDNLRAVRALNRIFEENERWEDLAEQVRHELELVEDEEVPSVKKRLARIYEDQLDEPERAVDYLEEVLEQDEGDAEALSSMEELMHRSGAPAARISRVLEPLYVEQQAWAKLVEALEVQVDQTADPDERIELRHRAARLREEELGESAEAFETYAKSLPDDPQHQETLDALYRLAEEMENWWGLVDVLDQEAQAASDPELQRDLLRRAASILQDEEDELAEAAVRLRDVVEMFPSDFETIDELESIYEELEDYESLVEILRHRAEQVEEIDQKKELLYRAGMIVDQVLDRPADSVEIYRDVLEVDSVDEKAIDELQGLYERLERWTDLLEVYDRKLDLAETDEERKDLLFVRAAIFEESLEQPYDAIDAYREILNVDAEERQALEKLAALYEQTEQWHELLDVLEQQRDLQAAEEEQLALQQRIGTLWETKLGDVQRAVEVYDSILAEAPGFEPAREALESLVESGDAQQEAAEVLQPIFEEHGEWEKLVGVKRRLVENATDPFRQLELYRDIGEIEERELDRIEDAFETYREAIAVEPTETDLLDTAERLAGEIEAWQRLIDTYDQVLAEESDFQVVGNLNRRIGRILEEELGNAEAAIDRFEASLEAEPEHPEVLAALDRLYQQQGHWERLADILQTRIYTLDDPEESLELRSRLGVLNQDALERTEEAIDVFQSILEDEPEHDLAIESLESMYTAGRSPERIMEILEPYYRERDLHEKLIELYLKRLERLEDSRERFELYEEVGHLYLDELEAPADALEVFGAALIERPASEQTAEQVKRLAEETGNWEAAASDFSEALEDEDLADDTAARLWSSLAQILDDRLGQMEDAEMCYRQVLEADPGNPEALAALDRILENQERWRDLTDILQRRLEATYDEDELVELHFRLAEVFEDQLGEVLRAVEVYRDLLDIRPMHEGALNALERIHRSREEWQELYDVLEQQADLADEPDVQADKYAQMATLAEEMLGQPNDAVDLWNRVLDIKPDDRGAMEELGRLYYQQERWHDLVSILERELELVEDQPQEALELQDMLGTVWMEQIESEGPALEAWQEALEIEPDYRPALEALHTLYDRQGNYADLADVVERLIEHAETADEQRVDLWQELAVIRGEMLIEPADAIEAWQQVRQFRPQSQEALDALEELYIQESRWEEAAGILEEQLERAEDEDERIDLCRRIAEFWDERVGDADRAVEFYERILEIDPTDMEASSALERIYDARDDEEAFQSLVELYLNRAEVQSHRPFERLDALRSASRVYEENLGRKEHALVVLSSAFDEDTFDDEQLRADMVRLAEETGDWDEVIETYEGVIRNLDDDLDAAELHEQVGRWYADKLDQPDDAIYHLRRAIDIDPERTEILDVMARLYRELEAWPELANTIEQQIEGVTDPDKEIELHRELGEIRETHLDDDEGAVDAFWNLLEIDQTDVGALESLERIYERQAEWEALIDVLERRAETTYEPDDIVDIRLQIATIWEQQLMDREQAIEAYRDVLSVEQDNDTALTALEQLYTDTGEWHELIDVYEQKLSTAHEPEEQVELHSKIAVVWEEELGDLDRALEAYNQVLMADADNTDAMRELERLYGELERPFDKVETLQRHVEAVDETVEKVELLNELARVQRDELEDPHASLEAYGRSLELEPEQPNVLFDQAALHEQTQNWESAIDAYGKLSELLEAPEDIADVLHTMGDIYESELRNDDQAEGHYLEALEADSDAEASRQALIELYERREDWKGLIELYSRSVDATRVPGERARYLARIGDTYRNRLGDDQAALDFYEEALEEDPRELSAAEPLIELYYERDRWERAVPLLEMVIEELEASDEADSMRLEERYVQLGEVCEELEQDEKALTYYQKAHELNRRNVDAMLGLGRIQFEHDEYARVVDILERLESDFAGDLDADQLIDLYYQLGEVRQHFEDFQDSADAYEHVLQYEEYHRPTLEALTDVYEKLERWQDFVDTQRMLLDIAEDDTERFARLQRIGEVSADKLDDPNRSVEAYRDALEIQPRSVVVLRKLLEIYQQMNQWRDAVDVLHRLIDQQDDPKRRAKFYYTMGVIFRDEIENPEKAVEHFDNALDNNLKMLKPFEAIDRILTQMKSWKELERAYRRMLRRVAEDEETGPEIDDVKFKLWEGLGEIYRSRLGHPQSAIEAFEIAAGLEPDNERIRLILTELYDEAGAEPEKIVEQHRALIEHNPFRIESYKALFEAYLRDNEYDRAWCLASTLTFLEEASDEEREFYERYRGQNLRQASRQLDDEAFSLLYHDDQEMLVNYIMAVLYRGLGDVYAQEIQSEWNLNPRKDQFDIDGDTMFARIFRYSADTVNVAPVPEVYHKKDQAMGLQNAMVSPPAIVVGADVVNKEPRELAFRLGKLLAAMRPEHYLGSLGWPTEWLKTFFMAAMHVTNPELGLEKQLGEQGMGVVEQIQQMPQQLQMQLRKYVSQYLEMGKNPNLSAWLRHVDHTTSRVGLLLCGDLKRAVACLRTDQNPIGKADVKKKVQELILFNISDDHVELRKRLGLDIGS